MVAPPCTIDGALVPVHVALFNFLAGRECPGFVFSKRAVFLSAKWTVGRGGLGLDTQRTMYFTTRLHYGMHQAS